MEQIIVRNRKARFNYQIESTLEAGIALVGTEIKSVRQGKMNISDAYVQFINHEAFLVNAHISLYDPASRFNHDPLRKRRLLLKKREIHRWQSKVEQSGYTVIPLKAYLKNNRLKIEIALAKGKRKYDKRESEKKRVMDREMRERH